MRRPMPAGFWLAVAGVLLMATGTPAFPAGADSDVCAPVAGSAVTPKAVFYVDPESGSQSGNGSLSSPFKDLNALLDPAAGFLVTNLNAAGRGGFDLQPANPNGTIPPGSTIMLLAGHYGKLSIANVYNDEYLTIRAVPGAEALFSEITIRSGRKLVFDGVTIRYSDARRIAAPLKAMLFEARGSALGPVSDIVLENASLATVSDSSLFGDVDWLNLNTDGVTLTDVTCVQLLDNRISNIRRGISNGARHATVSGNIISDFSGDGIRFVSSNQVYASNIIRSSRNTLIDPDHPDGMQGFAHEPGKELKDSVATDITISGNIIDDPIRPGYDPIQGISYFDGIFRNVAIFNNLVRTNSVHGISAYGGDNIVIAHNTVVSPATDDAGYTTIKLIASKTGAMPTNAAVVNNVTDRLQVASGVTVLGNALLRTKYAKHALGSLMLNGDPGNLFASPATGDFTPRPGSPLVDAGNDERFTVPTDLRGRARDGKPDIGAFEN